MKKILFFSVLCLLLVYCSRVKYETRYVGPVFDTSDISNVAILNFGNKSTYEVAGTYAADKLKKLLLKKTDFNFIEKNKIKKVVSDLNYNMTELNPRKIKKIGELLAADAVIVGIVTGLSDSHAQSFVTKSYDTTYKIDVWVFHVKSGDKLYNNDCLGTNNEFTIHSADPAFLNVKIARDIIDQCLDNLSSEFGPRKIRSVIK